MNRSIGTLLLLPVLLAGTPTASADFSHCDSPRAIYPPNKFRTDSEMNDWSEKMDAYSLQVETYLVCLSTYAAEKDEKLTKQELASLRKSHTAAADQARRIASSWNNAYVKYQKKLADSK